MSMTYKCVPFSPPIDRNKPADSVAQSLDQLIANEVNEGWVFVALENHSTVVPGTGGCFGLGAKDPYIQTFSVAVFRR